MWTNWELNPGPPADESPVIQVMLSGRDNQLHHMPYLNNIEYSRQDRQAYGGRNLYSGRE